MASLYQNIRGALQNRLAGVAGIPDIAYEGSVYTPLPKTPYVDCKFMPGSGRPATMGDGHLVKHQGTFEINAVYPSGVGTGAAEAMADTIKAAFTASTILTLNSVTVRLSYAERGPVMPDATWIRLPISVGWYLYSTDY